MIEAAPPAELDNLRRTSYIVGGIFLALTAAGLFLSPARFFHSYLLGYIFWMTIALGCLGILMLQHLTGGAWGLVIRRVLEAGANTLPLMLLLFLPIVADMFLQHRLYIWTDPHVVAGDKLLQHKSPYLNVPFFLIRSAIYFGFWLGATRILTKWSHDQDKADPAQAMAISNKFQGVSGAGVLIFALTVSFAAFDWMMSLDPHWYSTMFGVLWIGGIGLSTFAFVITVSSMLASRKPMNGLLQPSHFHDLGKLMLAFTMLWAYFNLSQFLIIWSGNLPEETPWYLRRLTGGLQWIGMALIFFHFALPFVLLLSRARKRDYKRIIYVAMFILVMRFVDIYWIIIPESGGHHGAGPNIEGHFSPHWLDITAPIGVGGIWLATFLGKLKAKPLLPVRDPYLEEAISNAHH